MSEPSQLPPPATRIAGLARMQAFQPEMGGAYAAKRNYDFGPDRRGHVACLSPHVRHRLVLEAELVRAALDAHGAARAEKFVQEVCWRTYWKGWLEMRPSVWPAYKRDLERARRDLSRDGELRARYQRAVSGESGLEPVDAWARELVETGYLHNHARMWFASIWTYTLGLPWILGADFFLRHLMDGDPASNTLSWRWVVGLQTAGKTYLARASNIHKFTDGRFQLNGYDLASDAPPLDPALSHPEPAPLMAEDAWDPAAPTALLLTDEDLHPESWGADALDIRAVFAVSSLEARSPDAPGDVARAFTDAAIEDGLARARAGFGVEATRCRDLGEVAAGAVQAGARQLVTMRPCVGPMRDLLDAARPGTEAAGVTLVERVRPWDRAFHPHASKGFFKLKQKIPAVLGALGLS